MILIIYLFGVLVSFMSLLIATILEGGPITIGDLLAGLLWSICLSWIGIIIFIFLAIKKKGYFDIVIWQRKKPQK